MMTAVDLVSLPSHLVGQCSDMHIRMMHIQHPAKKQQDLESFFKLREEESFCDMTFVTGGGGRSGTKDKNNTPRRCIKVHSLVIAASSDFLKTWMETTFVADLKYEIVLPDTDHSNLETLINILYGVDVAIPQHKLDQVHGLADMLGITVDLPFRIIEQSFNENSRGDEHPVSNLVTMSVGGEKQVPEFTDLENENAGVDVLPLCCWHCNRAFADLEELKTHVDTHKGERFKSKRHKCQKCKKILPSMWKLRQHLLTHASSMPKRRYGAGPAADHRYATSERQAMIQGIHQKDTPPKDHPYATLDRTNLHNETVDTPPLSIVSSEHSYGTRFKNNADEVVPGTDLMGGSNSRDRRYDHPYSAWENPTSSCKSYTNQQQSTPNKVKLGICEKEKVYGLRSEKGGSRIHGHNTVKRQRTISTRLQQKENVRDTSSKSLDSAQLKKAKGSMLAEMDHQYASNKNSIADLEATINPDNISEINIHDTYEHLSNIKKRAPSPPRGAAKRKASLNQQRARSKGSNSTTNNDGGTNKQIQRAHAQHPNPHLIEPSSVNLSKYNQPVTSAESHLVVRLHQLKTISSLENPAETSVISNKLTIPNNRTRADARRGKNIEATDFPCSQCNKTFPQRYRKARHIREVHDKEKRHHCEMCEKSFFKITSKERHELTHLKNRVTQWCCSLCSKHFSDESSLLYHMKNKVCIKRGTAKTQKTND